MIVYKLVPVDQLPIASSNVNQAKPMQDSTSQPDLTSLAPTNDVESAKSDVVSEVAGQMPLSSATASSSGNGQQSGSGEQSGSLAMGTDSNRNNDAVLKPSDIDLLISSIPKEQQQKSKAILAYLINAGVRVEPDTNRVIYEGGVIGSPLPDLLHWTIESKFNFDRPWDQMRFFRLLTDHAIPKSLFGAGKYRLANVASRPYPIAVKRWRPAADNGEKNSNQPPEKRWKSLF